MLVGASLLAVFLASAQAQPPLSPVLAAISAAAEKQPLPDLIKALDADGKTKALARLDRLDRAALDPSGLAELSEAYRLLGRTDRALEAARLLSAKNGEAAGATQEILALAQSGDYKSAQAFAEGALKKHPRDPSLLAAYHQVKNRRAAAPDWTGASSESAARPHGLGSSPPDTRPFVLAIKAGKSGTPPSPFDGGSYLAPGAERPSSLAKTWAAFWDLGSYAVDRESAAEKRRMRELRAELDKTETGRSLVRDLGGWERVQKDVDMRFTSTWDDGQVAYARPLMSPDAQGHRYALVINKKMMSEPDSFVVPVVAHELSHIRDFEQQAAHHGLAIPSEFAAHRTQIQVYEEMKAKMTPEQISHLGDTRRGRYQNFIAILWEDHILQRFKTPQEMSKAIGSSEYDVRARAVFRDLLSGAVGPGGPQLDHHLNGQGDGLYRFFTDEKDIVDLVKERQAAGDYPTDQQRADTQTLAKRAALISSSDRRDAAYRARFGFQIKQGDR
ncbi:MAG: hypothetical protein HYV14_03275 [Elusimicrobia bacterium]|nr:hypothetical protein [Elusimicrobiota bacterium]